MRTESIYETLYIVNSFHAVDQATREVIQAEEDGFISPPAGTRIVFANPNTSHEPNRYVDLNTLVVSAGEEPVTLMINDNEMYPFYVPANTTKGIEYIRVYAITSLSGGAFYYEGLSSET